MQPTELDGLLKKDKRVLVDFQAPWCGPCHEMAPVVDAVAQAWKGKVSVVRVDADRSEALAERENIEGVPTLVYYVDGKERWRHSGVLPRAAIEAALARP